LLLILLSFEALPLMPNSTLNTFHLAARQRVLEEHIVKNILVLAYRPQDEHADAISQIQTALPVWEQVENGLQKGDTSLGISPRLPQDMKLMLIQAQPDFVYLDTAARKILAHPSPVDQTELTIVLQHDQGYYIAMAQVVIVLQDDLRGMAIIYFSIELVTGIILMAIWISFLILLNRSLRINRAKHETL
jgi:hypothetical protein